MYEFEGHAHALRERKAPFLHCLLQTVAAQLQNNPADNLHEIVKLRENPHAEHGRTVCAVAATLV